MLTLMFYYSATIVGIVDAYKIGAVGGIFSCEDNSGTVAGG